MDEQNTPIIKFNAGHFISYLCIFYVPFFVSWITFVYLKIFALSDTFLGFTSPFAIVGVLGVLGFILFWYFSQTRKIMQFDPKNPDSVTKTNKIAKRFQSVTLAAALANAPLSAIIVKASFAAHNVFVDTLPLYSVACGDVFLIAQLFYSIFVQKVEHSLKNLPFKQEFNSMSLIMRSSFISIFGAIGFILLTVTPVLSTALSNIPARLLVAKYVFPEGVLSGFAIVLASILQMKSVSGRVKIMRAFTKEVA